MLLLLLSILLVVHEDDEESLEEDDGVKVDAERLTDGIPSWLALSIMDKLLDIIESEGAE